jgi:hypothetical protein
VLYSVTFIRGCLIKKSTKSNLFITAMATAPIELEMPKAPSHSHALAELAMPPPPAARKEVSLTPTPLSQPPSREELLTRLRSKCTRAPRGRPGAKTPVDLSQLPFSDEVLRKIEKVKHNPRKLKRVVAKAVAAQMEPSSPAKNSE